MNTQRPDPPSGRLRDGFTWWLTGMLAVWYLAFAYAVGPLISSDSKWYETAGDLLIAHWRDPRGYLEAIDYHGGVPVFYLGFTAVVGVARRAFGARGALAIALLNAVALAFAAHLVLRTAFSLSRSRTTQVVVAVLFAVCYEQLVWVPYVLSDATFAFLVTLVLCTTILGQRDGRLEARHLVTVGAVALLAPLYRPTGVLLGAWLLAVGAIQPVWREASPARRAARLRWLALIGTAVGGLLAFLFALVVMAPPPASPAILVSILEFVRPAFTSGAVVEARPETFVPQVVSALDVVRLITKRVVYFFVFWADGFSALHNVVNAVVYVPTYSLALIAIVAVLRHSDATQVAEERAVVLTVMLIAGFALMHAVTFIDFDWRYRAPTYPAMFLLAGLGSRHVPAIVRRRAGAAGG